MTKTDVCPGIGPVNAVGAIGKPRYVAAHAEVCIDTQIYAVHVGSDEAPGRLRLKTSRVVSNIYEAPNTVSQRMEGPECEGVVKADICCSRRQGA